MKKRQRILLFIALLSAVNLTSIFGQSGGIFQITQSVVTSGGNRQAEGGNSAVDSTSGQTAAPGAISGGIFAVSSGFWNFTPLAPTAVNASISGRILTADGSGIRNAIISLTTASTGEIRSVHSKSFGYYKFEEIRVGEIYILRIVSKRFTFEPDTRVVTMLDELTDVDFMAQP